MHEHKRFLSKTTSFLYFLPKGLLAKNLRGPYCPEGSCPGGYRWGGGVVNSPIVAPAD